MAISYGGDSVAFADGSTLASGRMGMVNRIINGDMRVDQRFVGAAFGTSINSYCVDRWAVQQSVTGKLNGGQNYNSITPPAGFSNYVGFQSQSAYIVGAAESFLLYQPIEGYNIADLAWGTANAKAATISAWVYSSVTGTHGGVVKNNGSTYSFPFTYSIPIANTWTQIFINIPAPTSGSWLTTNGIGAYVIFGMGSGSSFNGTAGSWAAANYNSATGAVSIVATNAATFYITGVDLRPGTYAAAPTWEFRSYAQEEILCKRYCPVFVVPTTFGYAANSTLSDYALPLIVPPRVAPTGITTTGTFNVSNGGAAGSATLAFSSGSLTTLGIRATSTAGSPTISQGVGTTFYAPSTGTIICTGCEL